MRDIKALSSRFVNDKHLSTKPFYWESGYVAFTCTHAQVERIVPLLRQQEKYHEHHTFHEEVLEIMGELNIPFEAPSQLKWLDALYKKSG
jgi:putative transposase